MPFDDPIVGGNVLIRDAIRSSNYLTGVSGWTINADGSAEFSNVAIVVSGTNGLQIIRQSDGTLVGSINSDGVASFSGVYVNSDQLYINGVLFSDIYAGLPHGTIAWGEVSNPAGWTGVAGGENPVVEVAFDGDAARLYAITAQADVGSSADGDQFFIRVRDGGASSPSITSTMILNTKLAGGKSLFYGTDINVGTKKLTFTTGTHRLLLSYGVLGANTPVLRSAQLTVDDVGPLLPQVGVSRIASAPVNPVQTYTTTFPCTWSRTYNSSNAWISFYGGEALQGPNENGNLRSMIGFNQALIASTLSGATILGCWVNLYCHHWYFNAGGTAVIGTHNASAPAGTFSGTPNRVQSGGWPNPGLRQVALGVTIGNEFKSSGLAGITLGPGPTSNNIYYGRFDGFGWSNPPALVVQYQK